MRSTWTVDMDVPFPSVGQAMGELEPAYMGKQ